MLVGVGDDGRMSDTGEEDGPSSSITVRRMKVPSTVHQHFEVVDIEHKTKGTVKGSLCKTCKKSFQGKNPTNLSNHLRVCNKELYDDVISK